MTLRTSSATRRRVVSRSSVVLTTSATASSKGSTFSWGSGWDVVECTATMIAAAGQGPVDHAGADALVCPAEQSSAHAEGQTPSSAQPSKARHRWSDEQLIRLHEFHGAT